MIQINASILGSIQGCVVQVNFLSINKRGGGGGGGMGVFM